MNKDNARWVLVFGRGYLFIEVEMAIQNIPSADDFAKHAIMFLNFAWDDVFDQLLELKIASERGYVEDDEVEESYLKAAQKPLARAYALAQQGAELALKSIIAKESPFLLISGSPREWPKGCDKTDISYADFRTIDSQDLIKVVNTTNTIRLPEPFSVTFENFRKTRNAYFHTVDKRLKHEHKELIKYILQVADLIYPKRWPMLRKDYLKEKPDSVLDGSEFVTNQLCMEMMELIDILGDGDLKAFFEFSKKQRRYICPNCYDEYNTDTDPYYPYTAILRPNSSSSKNVFCFVCGEIIEITRIDCVEDTCKGNVIYKGEYIHMCLTCGQKQGDGD